jgi:hypothetical protein
LDRLARFLLTHRRPIDGVAVRGDVLNLKSDHIAAAQFAVDGEIEQCQVTLPIRDLKLGADRPGGLAPISLSLFRGICLGTKSSKLHGTKHRPWLAALLARRPTKVAVIALANKIARMPWAMMARGERYKEPVALAA